MNTFPCRALILIVGFAVFPIFVTAEVPDSIKQEIEAEFLKLPKAEQAYARYMDERTKTPTVNSGSKPGDFGHLAMFRNQKVSEFQYIEIIEDRFRIVQIVGPMDLIISDSTGRNVWISNYDTKGLTDDKRISIFRILQVKEPHRYENATGSISTITHMSPLNTTQAEKTLVTVKHLRKLREWKDQSGKVLHIAQFDTFKAGKVEMILRDKTKVSIPMPELSKGDQKWVQSELKSRANEKRQEEIEERKKKLNRRRK